MNRFRENRGMTLAELLVVILIIGMLLAVGVAFLAEPGSNLTLRSTAGEIVSLFRNARAVAIAERAPTQVVIDTKAKTMHILAGKQVAMWHFEDVAGGRTSGGFSNVGTVVRAASVEGWAGQGLRFAKGSSVDCGKIPSIATDQGILISLWLYREEEGKNQIVGGFGKGLAIGIRNSGVLVARVGSRDLSSGDIAVPLRRWTQVMLVHDGKEMRLCLNGATVDWAFATGNADPWYRSEDSLILGATDMGFVGIVDEVRVALMLPQEDYPIRDDCAFTIDWEGLSRSGILREVRRDRGGATREVRSADRGGILVIHFDPQGKLDETYHNTATGGNLTFSLTAAEEEIPFAVRPDGTVEKEDVKAKKPPAKKG